MVANTITAREDRGVSVQNQTGTAVMVNIPEQMEIKVVNATKTGYVVARGGRTPSTSRHLAATQEEDESG